MLWVCLLVLGCKTNVLINRSKRINTLNVIRNNNVTVFYDQTRNYMAGLEMLVLVKNFKDDYYYTTFDDFNVEDTVENYLIKGGVYIHNKLWRTYIIGRWNIIDDTLALYPTYYADIDTNNELKARLMRTLSSPAPVVDTVVKKYVVGKFGLYDITDYTSMKENIGKELGVDMKYRYNPELDYPRFVLVPLEHLSLGQHTNSTALQRK